MDLFEYQARDLFAKHGVPVLKGIVATTPEEAKAAAEEIGGLTVIKAQVKTGGRGKAGGVKFCPTPEAAKEKATAIPTKALIPMRGLIPLMPRSGLA